ncbi:MAG: monovalent cation:proton antiporter family protein [Bacteroidota bacterium]|nr:monovalent cation:proton antiporter family protein [Bacteroidota bacterium]
MRFLNISLHFDYWPLLVIVGLAWLVPMAISLLRIRRVSSVILEIILGYFAGRYILINADELSIKILEFLALTGFIFLMFLSGLEIDMDHIIGSFPRRKLKLKRIQRNPLLMATFYFILCLIISYAGSESMSSMVGISNTWYFTLIMVTTSVGIILPVLKNRGETTGSYGQTIITSAAVADILSIILFTFTAYVLKHGFRVEILYILVLFALLYLMYRVANRFRHIRLFKKISFQFSHAASQLSIRGTALLVFIFVVISQFISSEVILLGAFISGILLSTFLHKERSLLLVKLDGMGYGFFIPIFFIMVGVKFDPYSLREFETSLVPILVILLILMYAIKVLPSLIWSQQFGVRKAFSGGILLSARLSLIIAASAIGLELGVITPGVNSIFIIMAIVSCFISPILYNIVNKKVETPPTRTIIVGGSSKGVLLARRLNMHEKVSLIIEKDKKRHKELLSKGFTTVLADGLDPGTYKNIEIDPNNWIFVDTGSDDTNIRICNMLRKELRHERIISVANHLRLERKLRGLDVITVDTTRVIATTVENLIIRPTTYHTLVDSFEHFIIEEIMITNPELDGQQLKNIIFHKDAILIMVKRENDFFVPKGDTFLREGDTLIILGTGTALDLARQTFAY